MRKNCRRTLAAWNAGRACRSAQSIWTDGQSIYSYATCLVTRADSGAAILNRTSYSKTTTVHQNSLAVDASARAPIAGIGGADTVQVSGLPRGCMPEDLRRLAASR